MYRAADDAHRQAPLLPRAVWLVAWGTAAIRGDVSPDEAAAAIVGDDAPHRVRGLPGEPHELGLTVALGRLRAAGVQGLRLVLPVPGDPGGLPGPARFNAEAVDAGEAALSVGGPALGLLPTPGARRGETVPPAARWDVHEVASAAARGGVAAGESLAEAERTLRESVDAAVEALTAMDVARAHPALRARLERAETAAASCLPPGYPPRAYRVLAMACRLDAMTALGLADPGAAVSARAADRRAEHLASVATRTRHALVTAVNAWAEPREDGRRR